jgi:TolB-like protein
MSKKKQKEISKEEKAFLMEEKNMLEFAAANNGPFSDLVLSMNFLRHLVHTVEEVQDNDSVKQQLNSILDMQALTTDQWFAYIKSSIMTSDIIHSVNNIKELELILVENDVNVKDFLITIVEKEVKQRLRPGYIWLSGYVREQVTILKEEAKKLKESSKNA